ncbi:hypothetical protein Taro_011909 [Colocasia esculenta]|uniref:Uncharacterized protein n=1 Tax=Colocasia esculenta TaxID=4460 RepID=A0A843UC22_COLES|nr:hypothetical protein [Colocasia esculenta]
MAETLDALDDVATALLPPCSDPASQWGKPTLLTPQRRPKADTPKRLDEGVAKVEQESEARRKPPRKKGSVAAPRTEVKAVACPKPPTPPPATAFSSAEAITGSLLQCGRRHRESSPVPADDATACFPFRRCNGKEESGGKGKEGDIDLINRCLRWNRMTTIWSGVHVDQAYVFGQFFGELIHGIARGGTVLQLQAPIFIPHKLGSSLFGSSTNMLHPHWRVGVCCYLTSTSKVSLSTTFGAHRGEAMKIRGGTLLALTGGDARGAWCRGRRGARRQQQGARGSSATRHPSGLRSHGGGGSGRLRRLRDGVKGLPMTGKHRPDRRHSAQAREAANNYGGRWFTRETRPAWGCKGDRCGRVAGALVAVGVTSNTAEPEVTATKGRDYSGSHSNKTGGLPRQQQRQAVTDTAV